MGFIVCCLGYPGLGNVNGGLELHFEVQFTLMAFANVVVCLANVATPVFSVSLFDEQLGPNEGLFSGRQQ